ncbi:MAG: hypothetical protein KDK50_03260, partial [Chlamydiia bacterium]|nr:hypothetical protein [Chlamydiia bacterium]
MQISAYMNREAIQSGAAKACSALTSTWSTTAGKVKICTALAIAGGVVYLAYRNRAQIQSMVGRVFSSSPQAPTDGGDDKKVDGQTDTEKSGELEDPDLPPDDDEETIKTDNEKSAKGSDAYNSISDNESEEANESDETQKQTGELKTKGDDGLDDIDGYDKTEPEEKLENTATNKEAEKPGEAEKGSSLPSTPPREEKDAGVEPKVSQDQEPEAKIEATESGEKAGEVDKQTSESSSLPSTPPREEEDAGVEPKV